MTAPPEGRPRNDPHEDVGNADSATRRGIGRGEGTVAEFQDRVDAGRQLAQRLLPLRGQDVVVLGLPRGGVPVAYPVAEALGAPLDVIVVRKLGVPVHPELAMGAIGEDAARVLEERTLDNFQITDAQLAAVEEQERTQLAARTRRFRQGRQREDLTGRVAVIVDDGIATGATARVACRIARQLRAATVILAAPVASAPAVAQIEEADEIVVLATPPEFAAVGYHYQDFSPTPDEEVVALLETAHRRQKSTEEPR